MRRISGLLAVTLLLSSFACGRMLPPVQGGATGMG